MKHSRISNWTILFAAGVVCLLLFAVFTKFVKRGGVANIDFTTTVKIQDRMPQRFDEFWEDVAFFVTPVPSVVLVGGITVLSFISARSTRRKLLSLLIPLIFGCMVLGEVYGKSVVHHPAPPFFMIKNPSTIFPRYYINEQFSYPSGHTARAVFLGGIVSGISYMTLGRRKGMLILCVSVIYCAAVAVGRIYLGHHWLSDVIGGVLLGVGFSLFGVSLIFDNTRPKGLGLI